MSTDDGESTDGYEVGYGKPPAQHQFKPGHTKSKGKRKKRRPSFNALLEGVLFKPIKVNEGGKVQKRSTLEVILVQLANSALKGDEKAILITTKLAQSHLPQDPIEEGEEIPLSDAERAIMSSTLAMQQMLEGEAGDE